MGYIARILTKTKINPKYELILVTADREEGKALPTIIVGRVLAQEILTPEEFNPVDRIVSDTLRWTYSEIEERSIYERDIENFSASKFDKIIPCLSNNFLNIINNYN